MTMREIKSMSNLSLPSSGTVCSLSAAVFLRQIQALQRDFTPLPRLVFLSIQALTLALTLKHSVLPNFPPPVNAFSIPIDHGTA